jgi:hypothetical protein
MTTRMEKTLIRTPFPSADTVAKELNLPRSRVRRVEDIVARVLANKSARKPIGKRSRAKGSDKKVRGE